MVRKPALVLFLLLLPSVALGEKKVTGEEWDGLYRIYKLRANLAQHGEAARISAELAAKYPDEKKIQLFCGRTAYFYAHRLEGKKQQKAAERGVECAQRVLDKSPKDYDGRLMWAMTLFKSKAGEGWQSALKESKNIKKFLENMIADNPKRFEAYMMLGALYRDLPGIISWGDSAKGLELLEKGGKLNPHDPDMLLELAQGYAAVGKKEKAKETYRKCINDSKSPKDMEWETEDAREYAKKKLKELE